MKQIVEEKDIVDSSKKQYRFNIDKFKRFLDENSIPDTWESMNLETFTKYQQFLLKDNKEGKKASTVKNIIKGTFFSEKLPNVLTSLSSGKRVILKALTL